MDQDDQDEIIGVFVAVNVVYFVAFIVVIYFIFVLSCYLLYLSVSISCILSNDAFWICSVAVVVTIVLGQMVWVMLGDLMILVAINVGIGDDSGSGEIGKVFKLGSTSKLISSCGKGWSELFVKFGSEVSGNTILRGLKMGLM